MTERHAVSYTSYNVFRTKKLKQVDFFAHRHTFYWDRCPATEEALFTFTTNIAVCVRVQVIHTFTRLI